MLFPEALLHRMQRAIRRAGSVRFARGRESFNRRNFRSVRLHCEHRAGFHRFAIEKNRASPANTRFAADVSARQPQRVAKVMYKQEARLNPAFMFLSIDAESNFRGHNVSLDGIGDSSQPAWE